MSDLSTNEHAGGVPQPRSVVIAAERRRQRPLRRLLVVVGLGAIAVIPLSAALLALAPGIMTWTAPVLCEPGYSDAFAVSDQYNVQPGETSWTFELTCINDRGESDVVGFLRPMVVVSAFVLSVMASLSLLSSTTRWIRRD